jgi:hypothetical protein
MRDNWPMLAPQLWLEIFRNPFPHLHCVYYLKQLLALFNDLPNVTFCGFRHPSLFIALPHHSSPFTIHRPSSFIAFFTICRPFPPFVALCHPPLCRHTATTISSANRRNTHRHSTLMSSKRDFFFTLTQVCLQKPIFR